MREERLRDLGGLTLEMYKRDRFNAGLVVERCAELVAIEARVQEIDALLDGTVGLRVGGGTARLHLRCTVAARSPILRDVRPGNGWGTGRVRS